VMEVEEDQARLMSSYLDNAQIQVYTVHHTKVGVDWDYHDRQPEINRLYFFREGDGTIIIRNREYQPKPGQLFLLPAGIDVICSTNPSNTFRKYWCHFKLTAGDIHLFQLFQIPHYVNITDEVWLENRFIELIELKGSSELSAPFRIKAIMYELISLFLEKAESHQKDEIWGIAADSPSMTKIHAILSYIDHHLSDQMSIEELASQIHIHPNYFLKLFKSSIGISPIVYINKKRMEKAQHLLLATDHSLSSIADMVGMEQYYFSRMFKKIMGLTPSSYRSMSINKNLS
jgi:AraC-like DNA-binding protein